MRQPFASLPGRLGVPTPGVAGGRSVSVRPPGSKSLTNRALLLAALAPGESVLRGALVDADDANRMIEAVECLGAMVRVEDHAVTVRGVGGAWVMPPGGVTVDLNNAGTATRFLAASSLIAPEPLTVTGNARMRQRPIGELIGLLESLGVEASWGGNAGCPPVTLSANTLPQHAEVSVPTTQSSQFVSALLLVGSVLSGGITVRFTGEVTSASYVRMTTAMLGRVGVACSWADDGRSVRVEDGLDAFELDVEPDASGACFWWALGALRPDLGVTVEGLPTDSVQGDAAFPGVLEQMGCTIQGDAGGVEVVGPETLRGIDVDLKDMPDAGPALAVVCAFADGRSVLRGVRTLRVKETDRIEALRAELSKVGAVVIPDYEGDPDAMAVEPIPEPKRSDTGEVVFQTYDDHRMAMALSLVGLRRAGIVIDDPKCVGKTYPGYWGELARVISGS